jgi:dTDP-4-amino-4,6-dideoxygalactose transaminase
MQSAQFINGPEVHNFQKELEQYLGEKHVIPCANGTECIANRFDGASIYNLVMRLSPQYFTFAATVKWFTFKIKIILVDVDYDTFNFDFEKLKAAITPNNESDYSCSFVRTIV